MTYRTLVRRIGYSYSIKGLSPDEVDFILWEQTAFPLNCLPDLRKQIHEFFQKVKHD